MPSTVGTYTLTYPANNTDGGWYASFQTFAQDITDALDTLSTGADLVSDTTPQLGGNLDINGHNIIDANGNEILAFSTTALADNHIGLKNNAITAAPQIQALGADSNVDLAIVAKGTGTIKLSSGLQVGGDVNLNDNNWIDSNGNEMAEFSKTASAVNYVQVVNSATGNAVVIQANGSDANIPLYLSAKGAGVVSVLSDIEIGGNIALGANNTYSVGSSSIKASAVYTDAISFDGTATFASKSFVHAWVNYDQTTTPNIDDSYNVSSVTDSATGLWVVNFTNEWADTTYSVLNPITNAGNDSTTDTYVTIRDTTSSKTTTACAMGTCYYNATTNKTYNDQNLEMALFIGTV